MTLVKKFLHATILGWCVVASASACGGAEVAFDTGGSDGTSSGEKGSAANLASLTGGGATAGDSGNHRGGVGGQGGAGGGPAGGAGAAVETLSESAGVGGNGGAAGASAASDGGASRDDAEFGTANDMGEYYDPAWCAGKKCGEACGHGHYLLTCDPQGRCRLGDFSAECP